MKATEKYLPVMPFIMLCKVVSNVWVKYLDEILKCDHSNESLNEHLLFCGAVYYAVQGDS